MLNPNRKSYENYLSQPLHWCPLSQQFAGADNLITALRDGWSLAERIVHCEEIGLSGARPVTIYHFELKNGIHTITMTVIRNPFLVRFIRDNNIEVIMAETCLEKTTVGT